MAFFSRFDRVLGRISFLARPNAYRSAHSSTVPRCLQSRTLLDTPRDYCVLGMSIAIYPDVSSTNVVGSAIIWPVTSVVQRYSYLQTSGQSPPTSAPHPNVISFVDILYSPEIINPVRLHSRCEQQYYVQLGRKRPPMVRSQMLLTKYILANLTAAFPTKDELPDR